MPGRTAKAVKGLVSGQNEAVANKGVLYTKIQNVHKGVTKYYHVFNTPLHSSRTQYKYRTLQVLEFKAYT